MTKGASQTPGGTFTFMLTDVEGSTRLWEEHPEQMVPALARHDALVAEEVARAGGTLIRTKGEGDSAFAVFGRASDAANAAVCLQRRLRADLSERTVDAHLDHIRNKLGLRKRTQLATWFAEQRRA